MHSVGVASQYCGQLGREGNCQVAVSLSVANHHASLPVAYRLYLPREWTKDRKRCRKAAVPATVHFTTKQQIALAHIKAALAAGVPRGVVLIDADYGRDGNLRQELRSLELTYVAAIQSSPLAWRPGSGPKTDRRLPITRREDPDLMSIKELALSLDESTWKTIRWREGSADWLESRFARVRARLAREDEQWLLIEWPKGEAEPTKYWFSTLPQNITFGNLVDLTKLRWRIERDYQELKQEVGLGHFEGRGWRGFHHHATLCIAAYGFLISERETIPPSAPRSTAMFQAAGIPEGYRPRGSTAAARAAHSKLDCDHASTARSRPRQTLAAVSLLRRFDQEPGEVQNFMTQ
jgi:SRSO17 transposase